MADDTDVLGRLLALEKENKRLWKSHDDLMRDQTEIEKAQTKIEKRLDVIEAWLAAEDDRLKPAAKDSTAGGH